MPTIQIRIDEKTKREAKKIFDQIGIDMSTAIKIYLKKIIIKKGIPFEIILATDDELKEFHKLAENNLTFWKNKKDDIYEEFYNKKKP